MQRGEFSPETGRNRFPWILLERVIEHLTRKPLWTLRGGKAGVRHKSVTIREMARMLNVTPTTVSLALRGKGNISAARREEIRTLAAELQYAPNSVAQALRGALTHTIGVIINSFGNPFFTGVFAGIEAEMKPRGYSFWVAQSGDVPEKEKEQARQSAEQGVDGLIVLPCGQDFVHLEMLRAQGKPVVLIANQDGGGVFDAVVADNLRGGEAATRHLCPSRTLVHIAGPETQSMSVHRLRGFLNVLRERRPGCDPRDHIFPIARMGHKEGYAAMEAVLCCVAPPLSVFAVNDETALGALKRCRHARLSVPEDVEIIGFGNIDILDMVNVRLSTIHIPAEQMGREAARMLLRGIEDAGKTTPCVFVLGVDIVPGDTTLERRAAF
jgi:LacI family transcriptional regulator